ncbi:MAG: YqeG family HAD IIIA-type phosphatase [Candidatus Zipacnadales bacterium]
MLTRFVPHQAVGRLSDIDLKALQQRGATALLLDLDNTITPWRSLDVPPDIAEWLTRAKRDFRLYIVSNTSKTKRLAILKEKLGLEGIGFVSKPWGMGRAMKRLGVRAAEAVVIGDQLLTDIAGGNFFGCYSILVKPLSSDEFLGTKLMRGVEALVYWWLKRRGLFVCPWR